MTSSVPGATADTFRHRLASPGDVPASSELAHADIAELQRDYLRPDQISAGEAIMGIDTRLVTDGTYFVVEHDGALADCGGWSPRATLYGGDHTSGRDDALLDPATNPARIRAMYTTPASRGEVSAGACCRCARRPPAAQGFSALELMATMGGVPLYTAYGFVPVDQVEDTSTGAPARSYA